MSWKLRVAKTKYSVETLKSNIEEISHKVKREKKKEPY
jgi:hypothetical protein